MSGPGHSSRRAGPNNVPGRARECLSFSGRLSFRIGPSGMGVPLWRLLGLLGGPMRVSRNVVVTAFPEDHQDELSEG